MTAESSAAAAGPAGGVWTFGLKRSEILSAAANGATLALVAVVITSEAITRLASPPPVEGSVVLAVAPAEAAVNVAATAVLARANRTSLNVRGALVHLLTDLYAFLGTAVAGLVIVLTGASRADAAPQILDALQSCLGEHFDVEHATFQLEPVGHVAHEHGGHP